MTSTDEVHENLRGKDRSRACVVIVWRNFNQIDADDGAALGKTSQKLQHLIIDEPPV